MPDDDKLPELPSELLRYLLEEKMAHRLEPKLVEPLLENLPIERIGHRRADD